MNKYIYSPTLNAFYPASMQGAYETAGTWPADPIDVQDAVFVEFSANQPPPGKTRIAGTDGLPAWGEITVTES